PTLPNQTRARGSDAPSTIDFFVMSHTFAGDTPFADFGPGPLARAVAGTLVGDTVTDCNDANYSWALRRDECYGDPFRGPGSVAPLFIRDTLTFGLVRV
ncbi:MAG: hypothetical protein ACT4PT_01910, partial [Methanobacteriota archaeon]